MSPFVYSMSPFVYFAMSPFVYSVPLCLFLCLFTCPPLFDHMILRLRQGLGMSPLALLADSGFVERSANKSRHP